MFKIRREQLQTFGQAASEDFEERALPFVKEFFPKHTALLGEEGARKVIRHSMARGATHGLTTERDLRLYLSLMCMLGSSFDSDPQMPWAAARLNEAPGRVDAARMERLYEKAMEYLDHVARDYQDILGGLANTRLMAALEETRHEPDGLLEPMSLDEFWERMLRRATRAFPARCAFVGDAALRAVIQQGMGAAKRFGLTTARSVAVYLALVFVLGIGFANDPLVPWAGPILEGGSAADQHQRVDQLYLRGLKCLELWLA